MDGTDISKGEQTRNRIIAAAYSLFVRQGFHATTLRQIARECGIAPGSAYNHFANKEEIFDAVFDAYHPYRELLPLILSENEPPGADFISRTARRMVDALRQRPDFLNLMFIELVEFDGVHLSVLLKKYFPRGVEMIVRGVEAGGSRLRPIPPAVVARTFIGLIFSFFLTEKAFPRGSADALQFDDHVIDHFIDIYLHGILDGGKA